MVPPFRGFVKVILAKRPGESNADVLLSTIYASSAASVPPRAEREKGTFLVIAAKTRNVTLPPERIRPVGLTVAGPGDRKASALISEDSHVQ